MKFYICKHCGNIIAYVENHGVPVVCCGEPMSELVPNTADGAAEKHVPVITQSDRIVMVTVGAAEHPMTDEHHIQWIALQTKEGNQRKMLTADAKPVACFSLCEGNEVTAAYAYCNLHGLWKK